MAIVGTGLAGGMHAGALVGVPGVTLHASVGRTREQAAAFAARYGAARAYADLEGALADADVQAVHLCVPAHLHEPMALAVAAAGRHLLVDKPLARTVQEADRIIAACAAAGVRLGVCFQHRCLPLARQLRAGLDAGRLGRVFLGDAYVKWYRDDAYYHSRPWRATRSQEGGGALINQAIHSIDLLQWYMGPVAEVTGYTARAAHASIEMEDLGVALLRFATGALGVIEGSTATFPGFPERIELHGERGTAILNEGEGRLEWHLGGEPAVSAADGPAQGNAADAAAVSLNRHTDLFRDFYGAVSAGRAPAVDGHEGRKSLEIVQAIYLSARRGRPVALPLTAADTLEA